MIYLLPRTTNFIQRLVRSFQTLTVVFDSYSMQSLDYENFLRMTVATSSYYCSNTRYNKTSADHILYLLGNNSKTTVDLRYFFLQSFKLEEPSIVQYMNKFGCLTIHSALNVISRSMPFTPIVPCALRLFACFVKEQNDKEENAGTYLVNVLLYIV